jgi:ribosome-interacting GTPase 1
MASTNQGFEYKQAEGRYLSAKNPEEKLLALEEMIRTCPKHKSSEKMLANLKTRLVRLRKESIAKQKKKTKHAVSVKKTGDVLVSLVGLTKSGKSALLAALTAAKPIVSETPYATVLPEQGVLNYGGCVIQIVELPSLRGTESDSMSLSILRMSDLVGIVIVSDSEADKVLEELKTARINLPTLVIHNKSDFILKVPSRAEISVSALKRQNIDALKDRIFFKLKVMRILTKEPGKPPERRPIVLRQGSTIKEFAGKIHKDFVKNFDHALVWGRSVKFQGQQCGFGHILVDQDIVEIHLKK